MSRQTAIRRLLKELALVNREPSWGISAAPVSEDDLFVWHCNVAGHPPGGQVVLHLELVFTEEYPSRPPRVEVLGSSVTHPNVFSSFICLDMLEGGEWAADQERQREYSGWSSAYNISAILRQLQTFFFEGDGTRWWACTLCTLHNPIRNRRCEACDQPRGRIAEIGIDVQHSAGFECRCGHRHTAVKPPFPEAAACEDAPFWQPAPDSATDRSCSICLGSLHAGPQLVARLAGEDSSAVCEHLFHESCARALRLNCCPLCRVPFSQVVQCGAPAEAQPGQQALSAASRERMLRFSEWPLEVVTLLMEGLLRPERAALGRAIPCWQVVVQGAKFWEAQELQCFHEKIGPEDDVIGVGVKVSGRRRLIKMMVHFDAVSWTAWQGGLRRAAWKEEITHWLPLVINRNHAARASERLAESLALLSACAPTREDSHLPAALHEGLDAAGLPKEAVDAVLVLPQMMHELVKQVVEGDRHASLKVLKGYFMLHCLLLHCCQQWPAIRSVIDASLRVFMSSEEERTKERAGWVAYLLQLLTVSNVSWKELRASFLEECLARQVQFTTVRYRNYRLTDPDSEAPCPVAELASQWALSDGLLGAEKDLGSKSAEHLGHDVWRGRERGWSVLRCSGHDDSQSFSLRIRKMPEDSVIRIGFVTEDEDGLLGDTDQGWGFHASACFGRSGFVMHRGQCRSYGRRFAAGDTITAQLCVRTINANTSFQRKYGTMRFQVNDREQGEAFTVLSNSYRPAVAIKRGAEVELLPVELGAVEMGEPSTEALRNMAWEANLRGNTLNMFQVFFCDLVKGETPDWEARVRAYEERLGFPSPKLAGLLLEHFGEVHRIRSLSGHEGWPKYLQLLGCPDISWKAFDRMQFRAYNRALLLNYKQGGRRDHA